MKNIKRSLFSFFFALLLIAPLTAQSFYWEEPEVITDFDTRFPSAVSIPNIESTQKKSNKPIASAFFWEEVDSKRNRIYLSGKTTTDGINWRELKRFAGPVNYSGEVPDIYSAAINSKGTIAVAALTNSKEITVFISEDGGRGFKKNVMSKLENSFIAPRIFATSKGGFVLFVSLGQAENFTIWYATSDNGNKWTSFKPLEPAANSLNAFVPSLIPTRKGDLLVFQAHYTSATRNSYQLYSSFSNDNCKTWSKVHLITDQTSMSPGATSAFTDYNNQRPYLINHKNRISITWERSRYSSENSSIWVCDLTDEGKIQGYPEQLTNGGNASRPILFTYYDTLNLLWFDNRTGSERIYLKQKKDFIWDLQEQILSVSKQASSFAYPIVSNQGTKLSFIWQQKTPDDTGTRLVLLEQDHTVKPPVLKPFSFKAGKKSAAKNAVASIKMTDDSSGIAGYSWCWTQDENEEPPEYLMCKPSEEKLNATAEQDGVWYFKARQVDFAGNWSDSVSLAYTVDMTPPKAPSLAQLKLDDNGMCASNSFTLDWNQEDKEEDFAGYTWNFEYIGALPGTLIETSKKQISMQKEELQLVLEQLLEKNSTAINKNSLAGKKIKGKTQSLSYWNQKNGIYKFSVSSFDDVGNMSETTSAVLLLNKYIPLTYISSVSAVKDDEDVIYLTLYGGGFKYDGTITTVYVDKDGKAPYDRTYTAEEGDFKVNSDNRITGLKLVDLDAGVYQVGIVHSDRGVYFKGGLITVEENGTVKIQNTYSFTPNWAPVASSKKYKVNIGTVLLIILFVLAFIGLFAAVRGLSSTAKEAVIVRREVTALITGDIMPQEKKKKSDALKQKGVSLKVKLAGFSVVLVITIVALVSVPLGYIMTRIQERTLSSGLYNRVNVLLDSLNTGAKAYLPTGDILQLSYLPDETQALPEAKYATITGYGNFEETQLSSVWATNDPDINSKINSEEFMFGSSQLHGETYQKIFDKAAEFNKEAIEKINDIAMNISELNQEAGAIALNNDEESIKRLEEIDTITKELNTRLNLILTQLTTDATGSFPNYDSTYVDYENTNYLFYKPVLYRQGVNTNFVRGIIFVEISTESLINESNAAKKTIIYVAVGIAIIAILIGFFGSLILATVIISPIRKLSAHVAMIRDTEDKESLAGKDIKIVRKDEIGMLGDTVNEMTHGLVQAARVTKNLVVGKDIQTKFIPLQIDRNGNALTTGVLAAKGADFFSYYAGADELSGDYFDYKKLDDHHYAVIKCDVSGHGVPAALIMIEVATLFLNYFNDWNIENPYQGVNIAPVVGKINDLLESRGFKGRFAAFTLCIIDTLSGEAWFCNAGDNLIHIYDGTSHKKKIVSLQETPAAGMFSTDLIDMKGGYKVSKLKLKKDDVLFLYTDGIEEAKRNFRDADYNIVNCNKPGLKAGEDHENHKVGENNEEMTAERVTGIIESVYAKSKYTLYKCHNPVKDEKLEFDFTECQGTAEDSIMALVSIEKVFRMYKPSNVKPTDKIAVDRKIDEFLRKHFLQYSVYCNNKTEPEKDSNFVYYNGVLEDPQYDDLTLVAIKKN